MHWRLQILKLYVKGGNLTEPSWKYLIYSMEKDNYQFYFKPSMF